MTTCPQCSSSDVVGFSLAPKGEAVRFTHCRGCEHGWWQEDQAQGARTLDDILARMSS